MADPDTGAGGVAAVVVTYRSEDHVVDCLAAIIDAGVPAEDITVWDNASDDRSADLVAGAFPTVQLVRHPENVGFAAAVNLSAGLRPGQDLLLVNPDAIMAPGSLKALRAAGRRPGVAVASARLRGPEGAVHPDSWRFPSPARAAYGGLFGLGRAYRPSRTVEEDVEDVGDAFVPFTVAVLERGFFDRLGGLDEAFWLYGEDTDYCLRVRRAGGRVVVAAAAWATHAGGASSSETTRAEHQLAAGDRFRSKHYPAGGNLLAGGGLVLGSLARQAAGALAGLAGASWRPTSGWRYVRRHYLKR